MAPACPRSARSSACRRRRKTSKRRPRPAASWRPARSDRPRSAGVPRPTTSPSRSIACIARRRQDSRRAAPTFRASTTGTSYVDASVSGGTYYYRVLARDAAGNESAPSNEASATVTSDGQAPTVTDHGAGGGRLRIGHGHRDRGRIRQRRGCRGALHARRRGPGGRRHRRAVLGVVEHVERVARSASIDGDRARRRGQHHDVVSGRRSRW